MFVSPRHAAKTLAKMGIKNITVIDQGDEAEVLGVPINGVFALPTGPDCLDTCGYLLTFPNGKSLYHTADTAFCSLLLKAAPYADVLLTCINGKWGNLHIDEAIELTLAVRPKYVIPNHYDVMPLNSENPESFRYFLYKEKTTAECVILNVMEGFTV
jgi:L-ascorbate 6-phosphate lactonase